MKFLTQIPVLRRMRIRLRLILAFLLTSTVPLFIISIYSFSLYSKSITDKISTSTSQTLILIDSKMTAELEKYQYLCGSICINEKIQNALTANNMKSGDRPRTIREIRDIIQTQTFYPDKVKNITIYDKDGEVFYNLGYDQFYEEDISFILSDVKQKAPDDSWNYVQTYQHRDTIVLARQIIYKQHREQILGYILVSIDEKLFYETVVEPVNLPESLNILYVNSDGSVLSSWDRSITRGKPFENSKLLKQINRLLPKPSASFDLSFQGERHLITYAYNNALDQLYISTIPYSYIESASRSILIRIIFLISFLLGLCLIIVSFIYYSIANPITAAVAFCHDIVSENFENQIQDNGNDELTYLSNSMNNMVQKIRQLLEAQHKDEKQKRELELQMLQYQINPHFLFNTLNSLRLVAFMNQDLVVGEGILALGSLLENTLTNKNEYITIQEELDNLKNYFSIQRIRYAGNFSVYYDVSEKLLDCIIPKLILQPLAENSIMHGSSEDGTIMNITIKGKLEHNRITLTLSDNGKGFDMKKLHCVTSSSKSVGIKNVSDRIRLNFGQEYSLHINSEPGKGTICTLTLPQIYLNSSNISKSEDQFHV